MIFAIKALGLLHFRRDQSENRVIETETETMTDEQQKNATFQHLISVMQRDAVIILEAVEQAAEAINGGRRNGAVGALTMLDLPLERIAALKTAVMLTNRIEPH